MKIGLLVFIANDRENYSKRPYDSIRAVAQQAETDGFDSIWLPDHLFYRTPGEPTRGIWECWTMLAALTEATHRVELGTLVTCNSFRNPAILAKMATTVDEISHGRLILGVGAGWNEPEYQSFGLPFDHRVDRFEEALKILRPLMREGHVDFAGHYYQARNCEIVPRGPRPEGPPLMVGSEGGPRMLKLTAQYADLWNTGYMGKPWFPDLQAKKPKFFDNPLTGTVQEIAAAIRRYAELGVRHIMFQCEPYIPDAVQQLTEALKLYHRMER